MAAMSVDTLTAAAFGADPGRWPLPAAATEHQLWLRAVAAGGQGRYASAHADLLALHRAAPPGPLASLALSTAASYWRQLGWHTRARGYDGRALLHAGEDPEAAADALVGLAADALGVGRFAAAAALLARADRLPAAPVARLPVRRAWVGAELAMATGDGAAAIRLARRAQDLVADTDLARHRVKSDLVAAAALCTAGRLDEARRSADTALDAADALGLMPLRWAAGCLLAEIGSGSRSRQQVRDLRDHAAERVRHGGGVWRNH